MIALDSKSLQDIVCNCNTKEKVGKIKFTIDRVTKKLGITDETLYSEGDSLKMLNMVVKDIETGDLVRGSISKQETKTKSKTKEMEDEPSEFTGILDLTELKDLDRLNILGYLNTEKGKFSAMGAYDISVCVTEGYLKYNR